MYIISASLIKSDQNCYCFMWSVGFVHFIWHSNSLCGHDGNKGMIEEEDQKKFPTLQCWKD